MANTPRKIKTTVDFDEDVWKELSHYVIDHRGGRKKNEVIQEMVIEYLRTYRKPE